MLNHNQDNQVHASIIQDAEIQLSWLSKEIWLLLKELNMHLPSTVDAMPHAPYSVYLVKMTISSALMMYMVELKDTLEKFTLL